EGSQHSQCEFIPFLKRVLDKARSLTSRKLLVRLDSAHDAIDTRAALAGQRNVSYIIKWNPRKEDQRQWAARIFEKGEFTTPRTGKRVGFLTVHIRQVYEGKTYQFKRVPSGKFATNALILTLGALSYNILRAIGQLGLIDGEGPVRHAAKRRRIKTVIQELMYLAGRLVSTGRRLKLVFGRHCPAFAAFRTVYTRFACG